MVRERHQRERAGRARDDRVAPFDRFEALGLEDLDLLGGDDLVLRFEERGSDLVGGRAGG